MPSRRPVKRFAATGLWPAQQGRDLPRIRGVRRNGGNPLVVPGTPLRFRQLAELRGARQDLNVPGEGFEPTSLAALDPNSSAFTNFATPAFA